MSDNWIALVPKDPRYIPAADAQGRALKHFQKLAPDAEEIEIKTSDVIRFFDCGENFERITCPICSTEISIDWWQNRMTEDSAGDGFSLALYALPCCKAPQTLNDLVYEWPQCFGRFALDAMNPNIGSVDGRTLAEFEQILETQLRVIYQHI